MKKTVKKEKPEYVIVPMHITDLPSKLNEIIDYIKSIESKMKKREKMFFKWTKDIWGSLTLINERLDKLERDG